MKRGISNIVAANLAFSYGFPIEKQKGNLFTDLVFQIAFSDLKKELEEKEFNVADIFTDPDKSSQMISIFRKYFKYSGTKTMSLNLEEGFNPKEISETYIDENFEKIFQAALANNLINDQPFNENDFQKIKEAYPFVFLDKVFNKIQELKELLSTIENGNKKERVMIKTKISFLADLGSNLCRYNEFSYLKGLYSFSIESFQINSGQQKARELQGYSRFVDSISTEDKNEVLYTIMECIELYLSSTPKYVFLDYENEFSELFS